MRLHLGTPREPLTVTVGLVTTDRHGKPVSNNGKRRITRLYGISWHAGAGFMFVGLQLHEKQAAEDETNPAVPVGSAATA